MADLSALRASIEAADALAHTEASYAAAADAYRSALALALRGTPRGSAEAKHCLLRMARLLRLLGRLEEAAKAFGAYLALTECVISTYERMACVLQQRMPALYADMVRAYDKAAHFRMTLLDGADAFLVGFPWTPSNGGRALCVADGLLPSLMKAWSACTDEYGSAALAAMTSERLVPLRDTAALTRAAEAAALRRAAEAAALTRAWEAAVLRRATERAMPAAVLQAIADPANMRRSRSAGTVSLNLGTSAEQLCNNARIAEAKGEWSAATELWEAALAKMCTPAVLRGVKCVDLSSMLCAHLMACPALSPAEQAAICDAWLLGYDRPEPLSLEALVAGRATFGEAVGSDADILQAVLDRRDACARGRHP
jgi:hypothetical protein